MFKSSKPKKKEETMNKKVVPIILIILGAASLLGAGIFFLDSLTAAEPVGLGKWIFDILGLLLGAGASIKGWMDIFKKKNEPAAPSTRIIAMDDAQINTGEKGRNIQAQTYIEHAEIKEPEQKRSYLHQLITPPADFTGREKELNLLLAKIQKSGVTISGLQGMGGIGKTALALKLADMIKDQFPDA